MQIDVLPGASGPSDSDFAAIAELPAAIMKAWGAHDARAFSDVFVENGSMVLPGVEVQGRERIEAFMESAFAGPYKGTQVVGAPVRATVLGEDSVIMFTEGGVRPADEDEVPDAATVRASWLVHRVEDDWQLASYQNTPKNPLA